MASLGFIQEFVASSRLAAAAKTSSSTDSAFTYYSPKTPTGDFTDDEGDLPPEEHEDTIPDSDAEPDANAAPATPTGYFTGDEGDLPPEEYEDTIPDSDDEYQND